MKKFWPDRYKAWNTFWKVHFLSRPISEKEWPVKRELANLTIHNYPPKGSRNKVVVPDANDTKLLFAAESKAQHKLRGVIDEMKKGIADAATPKVSTTSLGYTKASSYTPNKTGRGSRGKEDTDWGRCFVCLGKGHPSRTCSVRKQIDNADLNVKRNSKNDWILEDGSAFCWSYNSAKGCSNSASRCPNGKHICTGCLSSRHSAQSCSRGSN